SRVFELVAGPCAQRLASLHPPLEVVRGGAPEPDAPWETRVREGPSTQGYLPLLHATAAALPASVPLAPAAPPAQEPTLWQLHRTYIMAPVRGGLIIVDQHAAHERILYEEARARLEGERGASQQLLLPVLVDLSRDHFEMLLELGPWLKQLGWEVAPMGAPTVVIQGTPSGLRRDQPGRMLQDILDGVAEDSAGDAHRDLSARRARSF